MRKSTTGFTIVELLIVIVVIGILATITIVAYNGIKQRAITVQYSAAVDQWEKIIRMEIIESGELPNTYLAICLGKSAADFSAGGGFADKECAYASDDQNYYYDANSDDYLSTWAMKDSFPTGTLPTTKLKAGSLSAAGRGIMFYKTDDNIKLTWIPQVAGECGRGDDVSGNSPGSIGGGSCELLLSR